MNKYLCYVTGSDTLGYSFMQNVVKLAQKGAVLQDKKVPVMRFPQSAWMTLTTEEIMEDSPGFRFQIVQEKLSKEELEEMEWDNLRAVCKKRGITGRDRQQLIRQYFESFEDNPSVS